SAARPARRTEAGRARRDPLRRRDLRARPQGAVLDREPQAGPDRGRVRDAGAAEAFGRSCAAGQEGGVAMAKRKYEVHTHAIISGPNANKSWCNKITHSHEGGDTPHEHEHAGPACYTIDKDEWFRATGLKGGGRKKFTARPDGPQLPLIPREPITFEVI